MENVVLKWLNQTLDEKECHIDLACPVFHIRFLKSLPSRISLAIDRKFKEVEKVLYFESFIVVEPGLTTLKKGTNFRGWIIKGTRRIWRRRITAGIGAEAVREILVNLDLKKEQKLRESLKEIKSKVTEERTIKRLKLIESFISSGNKPEWMIQHRYQNSPN